MTKILRFLDERQYEVFIVGSLLREVASQEAAYEHYFNRVYNYSLRTTTDFDERFTAESTYFIYAAVGGREREGSRTMPVNPSSGLPFWAPLPKTPFSEFEADRGRLLERSGGDPTFTKDVVVMGNDLQIDVSRVFKKLERKKSKSSKKCGRTREWAAC